MEPNLFAFSRRRFVQAGAATVVGAGFGGIAHAEQVSASATMVNVPFERRNPRIGIIGTGGRGTSLLKNLLAADGQVIAICDVVSAHAEHAGSMVVAAGQEKPALYVNGDHAFETMLGRSDLDMIVIATPWTWHAEMAVSAMKHGKDVFLEVPGVTTLEDCWRIVKTSEETRKHCVMLENCCYGYNETLILRMVHSGKLGEVLYGEGAYLHDLRELLFSNEGEGMWRREEHLKRDGNLYPTHGLGPVANYMGVQRGDRFGYIVSMSTPARGLNAYRAEHLKAGDPRQAERYVTGDMNTSLIKTAKGLTITVKHTVSTPHPYDRINLIAGTKGIFEDYPPRLYLDGQNRDESWGTIDGWKEFEHPLWKKQGELAAKLGGHGGMDFIMLYRHLQCMREGLVPDIDVYDTAAWSSVGPLSVASVAHGSAPVEFPDFTRGHWENRKFSAFALQG